MKSSKSPEEYIAYKSEWAECLSLLRSILLNSTLEVTIKWGIPVYTFKGKNIVGIAAFKNYVGLWFYQGALLKDESQKLINAQEGVTQALRQWRFTSLEEFENNSVLIENYVQEAIANEKCGKRIEPQKKKPLIIPEPLQKVIDTDKELSQCFEKFTLSKKREFAEYIATAKM